MKKLLQGPKVGELNGGWAFLLKIMLVLLPLDVSYRIYVSSTLLAVRHDQCNQKAMLEKCDRLTTDLDRRLIKIESIKYQRKIER